MMFVKQYPTQELLKSRFVYRDGFLFGINNHESPLGEISSKGYVKLSIDGSYYFVHRLIYIIVFGNLEKDDEIDHKDNLKANNKIGNLRKTKRRNNTVNTKVMPRSKTKIKGVCWNKSHKKWEAQVKYGDITMRKSFDKIEDAEKFARDARELLHGEFHNHG